MTENQYNKYLKRRIDMARITHFDMSGDQPEKLIPFYEKIFKWKFDKWNSPGMEYWMITTGPDDKPGINGGLGKRETDSSIVNTIEVDNIDETLKQIEKNGGKVLMQKVPIPEVGWWATFQDPQQNVMSVMQPDPKAK